MTTKYRAKLHQDGSVEATSALVSPQDGSPALVLDGTVWDDCENDYPVSAIAGSRLANRIRKFFGIW